MARVVEDSYELIGERPTVGPNFMPIFIERFARERLEAVAQAEGLVPKPLPEALFVCVHNAGRSQMAAALAHELSNGRIAVRSAGSDPTERISPVVVEAMNEIGIDVRMEFPKPLTDEVVRAADVVVTMGCGDACPVYPGQALRGLAGRGPCGAAARGGPPDPLRHPGPCHRAAGIAQHHGRRPGSHDLTRSPLTRIAVITDIHGNLPALEASLEAIDALGIDEVYCGGDLVGYGPHPNEVCALIQ